MHDPLLRRAFSVMALTPAFVTILFRVDGRGTAWLSHLSPGDPLDVLGPLGTPWNTEQLNANSQVILVGGGVGVPPLVMLAKQVSRETPEVKLTAIIGARTASGLIGLNELEASGVHVHVATEDGSSGHAGRVTDVLTHLLPDDGATAPPRAELFACGPLPMLRAVALMAGARSVPCQVSLEENMPCGIGVCNGCVVATSPGATQTDYERYSRICVHGPVMQGDAVDWEVTC